MLRKIGFYNPNSTLRNIIGIGFYGILDEFETERSGGRDTQRAIYCDDLATIIVAACCSEGCKYPFGWFFLLQPETITALAIEEIKKAIYD